MEPIIVTCFCHNSCYLSYVRSLAFLISFLIVQQDIASAHSARRSTSFSARLLHSSRQICGHLTTPITVQLTTKSGASASLKQKCTGCGLCSVIDVWTGIQQSVIYNAIEWHRRLHTCIQSIGGHFEYSL